MATKPRTTRNKKSRKSSNNNGSKKNGNVESSGYFDSAYNAVSSLSVAQKVGITVSAMALLSTAVVRFGGSSKKKGKTGMKKGGKSEGKTGGDELETIAWNAPKSSSRKGKGEKIPTAQVTKAFQACLASKRPQQQLVADSFYAEINKWTSDQLDVDGQTIIVNFLFWYYRSMNVPETKFHSEQAEHIRYWADYPITSDIKWDYYNIKFDYMYSTALLQKSIPHMKKFYRWIRSETPRATPDDATTRKPNYYLTRYQAACILGDWEDGVKSMGQIIKDISSKATSSNATRNDYFMHYTLRALELPASNPNFGLIFKMVNKLQEEFPVNELAPPEFANWNILSFKYRNIDNDSLGYLVDQEFIFASDKIKDDDGWYKFYPQATTITSRLNKKINIWGRVCQMVSPVFGAAGFLPLTGSWSDTKLYMQTSWTFRGSGQRLTRKHVIMKVERLPIEEEVESKNYFGKTESEKGFVWKGHITVHMKKLPKGMNLKNLYDSEGEDYFDGEKAMKIKKEKVASKDTKGNGAPPAKNNNDEQEANNNDNDIETETQVYEVELVINKDDPADKDKDLKKKILSAMSSNSSTPR